MPSSCASQNGDPPAPEPQDEGGATKQSQPESRTPEKQVDRGDGPESDSPGQLAPFDWADFEARYEKALREADAHEREILKEAQHLSTTWASAAAAHDDERAVKRLRTRQRFVNLSEEKVAQKQQHCGLHNNDLSGFFQSHFAAAAVANFDHKFQDLLALHQLQGARPQQSASADDDDGLGYYADGVKRTLTDEQIEIFRQSELRELLREQQPAVAERPKPDEADEAVEHRSSTRGVKRKKKGKYNGTSKPRYEPKPDLRKRTWDVVEPGLDTLDYD
ncbi:hypothetical protein L249_0245 [Ophiocordyceps polyrhachis-furcata BCC 54312]|uniref:Uncharacterized protein n=1 Tax=Ophiocordyceps polyrhachis-furcata BCC 54312 TaxID=1330021 RepID=A0A367LCM3_9HYPO|nr:hypothetical protein L249_0245 [Ophiocordyceps polyrhachis-furcata BCC 54312]